MAKTVKFQDPGEGIREAEVVEILVSAGDTIDAGQQILTVETDKADFEVQSPRSGVVEKVRVEVGDMIEVGQTLLTLGSDEKAGKEAEDAAAAESSAEKEEGEARDAEADSDATQRRAPQRRTEAESLHDEDGADAEGATRADEGREEPDGEEPDAEDGAAAPRRRDRDAPIPTSPATRRIARELGVSLDEIEPSGEDGRVLAQDVRAHAEGARRGAGPTRMRAAAPALPDFSRYGPVDREPLRSVRRTIARRMAVAWEQIPHVTHNDVADVTELEAFRRRQAQRLEASGEKLTLTALVLKAVAAVLGEFPRFNASLDLETEEIVYKRYVHLGVAVDTERGLIVPSIEEVDRKSVRELSRELAEVSERARAGRVSRDEMLRGSFTITNVGGLGGTHFTPIINHPQVAILGLGRMRRDPCFEGDSERVVSRRMLPLSLGFDHRVNDGADAARFTNRLIEILADPERFAIAT